MAGLGELVRTGGLGPAPLEAYAVTPAVREWYPDGDVEELEYEATLAAAAASLRRLAAEPSGPRRRVVVAADIPDGQVTAGPGDDDPARVTVHGAVLLARVASVHVDEADLDPTADPDEHELLWYATQEIGDLLVDTLSE
jgi:hypothetical protein